MTIEEIRKVLRARPFRQFLLEIADGRTVYVSRSEGVAQRPDGQELFIFQPDDSFEIVNVSQVRSLIMLGRGTPSDDPVLKQ